MTCDTYRIVMRAPLGNRSGKLTLCIDGDELSGIIEILGHCNEFHHGTLRAGHCQFAGEIKTLLRSISYSAEGCVGQGSVSLQMHTKRDVLPVSGQLDTEDSEERS